MVLEHVREHPEVGSPPRDVQRRGEGRGLPGVGDLGRQELVEPRLDPGRDAVEQRRPRVHVQPAPRPPQRSAGRGHRRIHVILAGLVHQREDAPGCWVHVLECAAIRRTGRLAIDMVAYALEGRHLSSRRH